MTVPRIGFGSLLLLLFAIPASAEFTMSSDGVHVNQEGHEVLASVIAKAWGLGELLKPETSLLDLISQRQQLMHEAWLSEFGHERPGVKAGLPIEQAQTKADEIEQQIRAKLVNRTSVR